MKRLALATLLLLLAAFVFADAYTIGTGTSTASGYPFNGLWDYSWTKVIYTQGEINAAGLNEPASFSGIGFYVGNTPNNYTMEDQRVYARHTEAGLYDTADTDHPDFNDFQLLFQGDLTYNGGGWFYIVFSSPFDWNGNQNIEFLFENWDGDYVTGYPTFRYTSTSPDYMAVGKNQDNNFPAGIVGTRSYNRPNIQLVTPTTTPPDAAVLVGPADGGDYAALMPTLSWAPGNIWPDGYKLSFGSNNPPTNILDNVDLENVTSYEVTTPLNHETIYYWQVVPYNNFGDADDCPVWSFTTHPDGFVTVGEGNQNALMPFNFYYKSSLHQALYFPDELGFISGTITGLKLYNQFTNNITDTPVKIWMGNTALTDLSGGYIPASEMSLVYDGNLTLPSGQNDITIQLNSPFVYTPGNLVIMFLRPLDAEYYSSTDYFKCQTIGNNRARNTFSDSIIYDPMSPPAGTLTGQFPKTSFIYQSEEIINDLGIVGISTPQTLVSAGEVVPVTVSVKNNGSATQNTYQVKLMQVDGGELASVAGNTVASMETVDVLINWTPAAAGDYDVYAVVVLANDEIEQNNQSATLNINVLPEGVQVVTVGEGDQNARFPLDFYWKNSLNQSLYFADELGITSSTINGIQLYNQFTSNIASTPIKVWMGTTQLQDLSDGYIPSTQLTLVYDGDMAFPSGANDVFITLQTPFQYNSGNLVVMMNRPMDTAYYSSSDFFKCQTIGANRARNAYSDSETYDPAAPPAGTLTGQFPKMSFFYGEGGEQEDLVPPVNLTATVSGSDVHLSWLAPGTTPPPPDAFEDGFETYTDFALDFAPWVTVDVDQSTTYGMTGTDWPNAYAAQAYIIFNPSATTPPLATLDAHGGSKMAACFAATASVNNDWLISPILEPQAGQSFNFWARSYTAQYGLERFKVGVSNGGTAPANFNIISTGSYISAPEAWTLYSYDLSAYAGQEVRVGIQCVSDDAFFFLVDDVSLGTPPSNIYQGPYAGAFMGNLTRTTGTPIPPVANTTSTRDLLGYKVYRDGVLINTINNAGTLVYDDLGLDIGTYSYTVTAVYTSGESEPAGPVTATVAPALDPPTNLTAEVVGANTVELNWTAPGDVPPPPEGQWITWCNDVLGNSVGTGGVVTFDVAHRFTQADLASVAGGTITQVKFVPNHEACVYTVKVWTGGSASNAGTLVSSQVVPTFTINQWNTVVLNTPVPIPTTGDVYIGYESNTQGGHPAGCDAGPPIEGKGNMMYFQGEWDTLTNLASSLTYNWLIETYVGSGANLRKIELAPIVEAPRPVYPKASLSVVHTEVTPQHTQLRNHTGFKVYRDGNLIHTITNPATTTYSDAGLALGTYSYTVTAVYAAGESEPAGPATATIHGETAPPINLTADVEGRDVTLNWESPEAPQQGEWITWCNDVLGNSIGTGGAATFAVAHRFTQADLASVAGGTISQLRFVPNEQNCVYTAKVWTGGSASNAGTLVSSQLVPNFILDEWNTVVLNTPVPIPTTGDVYIGYEAATQTGYPAGCDAGPPIEGKGNMMYLNGAWDTLTNIAASLTYNWLIETFVATGSGMKNIPLTPIVEAPQITMDRAVFDVMHKDLPASDRAVAGFKVYRDNVLIATLNDPLATTYTELEVPNGTYTYGVSAVHTTGESPQATIQVTVDLQMAEVVFEDGFENYDDFATLFAPWTLLDVDLSETYGFSDIQFPNSGSAFAYIIFNPSATVPPITGLDPHAGSKMAASFAAVNPPNNDWMITPRIQMGTGSAIKFYARSHTTTYGLERFRVGVSLLPTIVQQGFQWVNGAFSEAPANWTEYIFDLSAYDNQAVRIAIRCISDDSFVFYVDDFSVHSDGGYLVSSDDTGIPAISTNLQDNYPNPFNPETTIRYSLREAGPVSIQIYNLKGQLVNTLVNEAKEAGNHSVVWNGKDKNNRSVSSGVYYYKMNAGKYSSTKKMILMK
ncbi:MAG: choice-of-anchor J domain-containing protein [Candidatus Cloacimonadaceae bacterium]